MVTQGDASLIRKRNMAAVLRTLHHALAHIGPDQSTGDGAGGLTVTELAAACGVSRPTAEDVAESLLARGWIEEATADPSRSRTAGRPARRFRFRADAGCALGIDIGTHSVTVLVADLVGTTVATRRAAVGPDVGAPERLQVVRRAVREALTKAGVPSSAVLAATVATTGILDADGRVMLASPPGWTGLDLAAEIGRFLKAPISVHNDMRLGAVAERWRGAAQDAKDVVYVLAGRGMGTALLIDGQPHVGFHGAAGELTAGSAQRWLRAYELLLAHGADRSLIDGSDTDAGPVFDAAARGDAEARRAVSEFARELVAGVESLVATIDPEIVVIGGSLSRAGESIAEPVRRHLQDSCPFAPTVAVSALGEESVALGAVRAALDDVEARLFSEDLTDHAPRTRG